MNPEPKGRECHSFHKGLIAYNHANSLTAGCSGVKNIFEDYINFDDFGPREAGSMIFINFVPHDL